MAEEAEFDFGDNVDTSTFEQILDMDEGEEEGGHEFSKSIVFGFLDQAETTFVKMDAAKKKGDLSELSSLGHFLKGSSATLGFTKVKEECEKIQHYGQNKDESGVHDEDDDAKCLRLIGESIQKAQTAYRTIKKLMEDYYAKLEEGG